MQHYTPAVAKTQRCDYTIYVDSNKAPTLPFEALLLPLRMPLFCSFEIIALVGCGFVCFLFFSPHFRRKRSTAPPQTI